MSERLRGCGQGSATADPLVAAPPRPAARAGAAAGRCYEESVSPPVRVEKQPVGARWLAGGGRDMPRFNGDEQDDEGIEVISRQETSRPACRPKVGRFGEPGKTIPGHFLERWHSDEQ